MHNICESNFRFDRENFDQDGIRNDLDSQCYMHCILGTIGVIDNEQNLHIEVLMPGIDDASARHFQNKCGELREFGYCFLKFLVKIGDFSQEAQIFVTLRI